MFGAETILMDKKYKRLRQSLPDFMIWQFLNRELHYDEKSVIIKVVQRPFTDC